MIELDYENASYDDGGTGLSREIIFKTLFVGDEPGFNASIYEEINVLSSEVNLPETLKVSEVRAEEVDESLVDLIVRCPELSVGTQTSRGQHERLTFRDDVYDHYRVGIEAG